jgi:hypothetical protein
MVYLFSAFHPFGWFVISMSLPAGLPSGALPFNHSRPCKPWWPHVLETCVACIGSQSIAGFAKTPCDQTWEDHPTDPRGQKCWVRSPTRLSHI